MHQNPKLKNTVRIKRLPGFCQVVELLYDYGRVCSPAAAFLLSHCTGEYTVKELSYIVSEVFQWGTEKTTDFIKDTFDQFYPCIQWQQELQSGLQTRYQPQDFLYAPDFTKLKDRYETPVEMVLVLTNQCNFRCIYCYNSSGKGDVESELSINQWLELIEQAADMGIVKCTLTGGEPMLHPYFFEILQALYNHDILAYICTNGSLIDQAAVEQFVRLEQPFVQISMDAPDDLTHNRLTGAKDSLGMVKSGIQMLVKAGIRVHIKAVILPETIAGIGELIEECIKIGVSQLIIDRYDLCFAGRGDNRFFLTQEEEQKVMHIVEKKTGESANGMNISTVFPPRGWKNSKDIVTCGAFYRSFTVMSNGDYPLCEKVAGISKLTIGNFRDQSLKQMWNSSLIDKIMKPNKEHIDPVCKSCEHFSVCGTGCFAAKQFVTKDIYAPDPNCWKSVYRENEFLQIGV